MTMPDAEKSGLISKVVGPKADGIPIREIVGEDPVEFVEAFVQNYSQGGYVPARARKRLTDAIERTAGEDTGREGAV
jgi:hypothetical protein